jgi:hypothetical protein
MLEYEVGLLVWVLEPDWLDQFKNLKLDNEVKHRADIILLEDAFLAQQEKQITLRDRCH